MNLNAVLGEVIAKGALGVTRKPLSALRRDVADLKRQVSELKRVVRAVQKDVQPRPVRESAEKALAGVKPSRIRPTGPMVRQLRKRLGMTQVELAKLVGVSGLTISKWESAAGRIRLRNRTLTAFAKVRGMGKLAAKKALGT